MAKEHRKPLKGYDAYIAALAKAAAMPIQAAPVDARIVVATCTGSRRLTKTLARSVSLVVVTDDPAGAVKILSERFHGAGTLSTSGQRFTVDSGWTDWAPFSLTHEMVGGKPLPEGVSLDRGALLVRLGPQTSEADFRLRFSLQMDRQRYDEALTKHTSVAERLLKGLPLGIAPRYDVDRRDNPATWRRVRNIYVFDPWRDLQALAIRAASCAMDDDAGLRSKTSVR